MKKIAMFGGSFNPIHKAHINLCEIFIEKENLTEVILVPTNITPLKNNSEIISPVHRLNMCTLATKDHLKIKVSDIEIKRKGKSFTSDTIKELKKMYDDDTEFFLIVGADMFLTLDKWHDFEYIMKNAVILASLRDDVSAEDMRKAYETYKKYGCKARFYDKIIEDISSTKVRQMIKNGENTEDFLDRQVIKYIEDNKLYGYE